MTRCEARSISKPSTWDEASGERVYPRCTVRATREALVKVQGQGERLAQVCGAHYWAWVRMGFIVPRTDEVSLAGVE